MRKSYLLRLAPFFWALLWVIGALLWANSSLCAVAPFVKKNAPSFAALSPADLSISADTTVFAAQKQFTKASVAPQIQPSNVYKQPPARPKTAPKPPPEWWTKAKPYLIFGLAVFVALFLSALLIVLILGIRVTFGRIMLAFAGLLVAAVVVFLLYLLLSAIGVRL